MAAVNEKPIKELIGDFYEAHANGDEEKRLYALKKIQSMLFTAEIDSTPFVEYYNEAFTGRTSFNTLLSTADYPNESVMRELLQNAFGCLYETNDIKIFVDFMDDNTIGLSYNEAGFTMEDILYYLSFGRNSGDTSREGRFGVGAKSVFLNVNWLSLYSNNFSFRVENHDEHLKITELNLLGSQFKGTRITFQVNEREYTRLRNDFELMTERRGDYINLVELCFAFNRKKVMNNKVSNLEDDKRTVNIAVAENGKPKVLYKIMEYKKSPEDSSVIRFMQNNKSIIDFLHYENEGFVYLIPYAVANTKRESVVKILLEKYNYFSTFELTGLIRSEGENFVDEKLSAFFVSVPNSYITACRTGIRADCEQKVCRALENDLTKMLQEYKEHFVIELYGKKDDDVYFMYPESYAFEFFKNYIATSRYAIPVRSAFVDSISMLFPGEEKAIPYFELKKTAFQSQKTGITKAVADEGTADSQYLDAELSKLDEKLSEIAEKTLYVGYEWGSEDGSEKGRKYIYKFLHNGKTYIVDSRKTPTLSDYDFYLNFPTTVSYFLDSYLTENGVESEQQLEEILTLFDEACNENYELAMKYYQFYFDSGTENFAFDVSKIVVNNLKNAMETVARRKNRFTSNQNYNEVVAMLVNSFTQGKETMEFLREIKTQGGEITLVLDFNNKYRFSVYGKQFLIPNSITNADLLELVGDVQLLIDNNIFVGRAFDFGSQQCRYSFDPTMIASLLGDKAPHIDKEYVRDIIARTSVTNLKSDHIALLDEEDKMLCIKEIGQTITEDEKAQAKRFVIMRDDYSKSEFSEVLEYLIAGENEQRLKKYFNCTKAPNVVITDQIPFYLKQLPYLSRAELEFVIERYKWIKADKNKPVYNAYFAKDINSKIFGYGGICSSCGYESEFINCFTVKEFDIGVMDDNQERNFKFSLYLCNNDASASDGWFINDISIGGMAPFKWLEEIKTADVIPPEFFVCTVKFTPQITYDVMCESKNFDSVVETTPRTLEISLTPLMAAKWIVDNN